MNKQVKCALFERANRMTPAPYPGMIPYVEEDGNVLWYNLEGRPSLERFFWMKTQENLMKLEKSSKK